MDETPTPTQQDLKTLITELVDHVAERVNQEKRANAVYANNTRLELSVWDLKILFGQLDQFQTPADIKWHTAVTVPWIQAKLLDYYLRLNIAYHEKKWGRVDVPASVVPTAPQPPTDELNDPDALALWEIYKKIHAEMFGS